MKNVVDASFILDFLLPDEHSTYVIRAFEEYKKGEMNLIAPIILPFEIANGLKYAVGSKRIKENVASELLEIFFKLDIGLLQVDMKKTLLVSLKKDLSIYDASYVYLSENLRIPLLTLDNKLLKLASRKN